MQQTATKDKKKLVEITVNHKKVKVPKETTGAEIKRLAEVGSDFQLFLVKHGDETEIGDDEPITVRKGMKFSATPTLDPS